LIDDHFTKRDGPAIIGVLFRKYKEPVSESRRKVELGKKTMKQVELCQGPYVHTSSAAMISSLRENKQPPY